ncbi:MAG: DUF559 domain-containing protein [Methylobacterium sp.]|uniref:endonuclease domain-containing protein n=1 Tax=Methylobacterium sp. TaxID=409 RepID=UPI0025E039FE|nr:DUF559 domain-containing protein [Methylobacterium sp.]MBX9932055.1 DUF559 domain-containing protein [Methylobacterium sp.]
MSSGDPEETGFRRRLRRTETEAERRLWHRLRDRRLAGFKFIRQVSIGRYVVDLACREARLIVEADGSQHAESPYDKDRDVWLTNQGFRILRFWNHQIMNEISVVLDTILAALPPSPRGRGEDAGSLAGAGVSPKGEGEGVSPSETLPTKPPHLRSARLVPDKGNEALSPQAGRGEEHA